MTDQEKINAIIQAIQDNDKLITLLKIAVTNNIPFLPTVKLDALMQGLGLNG